MGIGAAAISAVLMLLPGSPLVRTPVSLVWVALAVLVALIPVRRLMGAQNVNLGSLVIFTTLLLFGTGTALVAGWAVGIASVLSSPSGNRKYDFERVMLNSGKYVAGIGVAGLVLWGTAVNRGALDSSLGHTLILRLLAAYALHLGTKGVIKSVAVGLRDGRHPWDVRLITLDWLTV